MKHIIKYAKEHFIGFAFSIIFGVIGTTALFYFTASPTSSSEIKEQLKVIIKKTEPSDRYNLIKNINFTAIVNSSLDLSSKDSIFAFGSYDFGQDDSIRFIAIFEPKSKNLIDKLVGRSGFYNLASISKIEIGNPSMSLVLDSDTLKIKDIDLDGNKEIIFTIANHYADGISSTNIILKKDVNEKWHFLSPPTLKEVFSDRVEVKNPHPDNLRNPLPPTIWFGLVEGPETNRETLLKKYRTFSLHEETWQVIHNDNPLELVAIRAGISIKDFQHPYKNYYQLGLATNLVDDNSTLSDHHIMVTFLKIENNKLVRDLLWNWGYPMLSQESEDIYKLRLEDFQKVGVDAHVEGGTFFTHTDFKRH